MRMGSWEEQCQQEAAIPKQKDTTKIMALPPNDDTTFVPASEFPGAQLGTRDNQTGPRLESTDSVDESKLLGYFSDALSEMAESLMDLEDGYFKPLH